MLLVTWLLLNKTLLTLIQEFQVEFCYSSGFRYQQEDSDMTYDEEMDIVTGLVGEGMAIQFMNQEECQTSSIETRLKS